MKPRFKLIILLLFIVCNVIAQNKFKYQTFTDSVVKDGFYQINLLPDIVGKSKSFMQDVRLFDINNRQIPYLIQEANPTFDKTEFIALKKKSEQIDTNLIVKILIENPNLISIDNLVLVLKNSWAERSVNISGSNDLKHWYVIREYVNLEMTRDINTKHFLQSISLPNIDYRYLKIDFNGKQYDPMFIEQVGTYKTQKGLNNYFQIPAPIIKQSDSSNKLSYVNLFFNSHYKINKLQLFISGQPFYERVIFFRSGKKDPPGIDDIDLISSKSDNIFFDKSFLGKYTTNTNLQFTIQNNDNPPLKIDSVKAYQNAYALFAYLKAGKKYKLGFGNDSLAAPVYDIAAFSDSIKSATLLSTGEITENKFASNETKTPANFNNKIWLWTAIIVVLLILLYFTSTMLKQINKKQQADF